MTTSAAARRRACAAAQHLMPDANGLSDCRAEPGIGAPWRVALPGGGTAEIWHSEV
eukprot:CAMPEP_0204155476 /NCGR_PEP_ID=MMETSP0361-20130328/29623_1 /ASSEMBLY_ACC=CAM_ASM_000343 /TAXON_ID=268821 /ORGANISM="Scrippsiella Hangoei, Strain SHTV-5" /LENGTH=55 /DNA_ID=CAMNT_0051110955 /DNA_START=14 /DNA_END=178 /DNA_ORIENTATION=+